MSALTGTGHLVRLALRRDRVVLPLWTLALGLLPAAIVPATDELFPTAAERLTYAESTANTPTFLALYGPLYDPTLGAIVAQRSQFVVVIVALACALTVVRHTRTEEEAGRRELLGSLVLGRGASLAAALIVAGGAALTTGVLVAAGMTAQGSPVAGSIAFGGQLALAGLVFAAVAGVTAQLAENAGASRGLAIAALGGAYVVRLAADVGGVGNGLSWLSWASPFGWTQRLRPYADENWWPLLAAVALAVLLTALAARLSAGRDLGAGVLPPRLGPARAPRALSGVFGLAWRLHSRTLYGWLAGVAVLGVVYGAVAGSIEDLMRDNPEMREIMTRMGGGSGATDAYFSSVMEMLGLFAAAYAVSASLKPHAEEASLRAEPLLSAPVSRLRWLASHLLFAFAGPAALLAVGGLATGVMHALGRGGPGDVPSLLGAALAQAPAVWLIAGVAVLLFGLLPGLSGASWAVVGVTVTITLFGAVLDLSQPVRDLSPFTHVPRLPGPSPDLLPLAWLLLAALALTAAGLAAFRRRDLRLG
ncbi:ABC transporter permease [Actinomadura flavalba]|uniref:ABC transporter permease n=1 Tax=Actinomadura flavalba TaxID=1120938 RepID=UPI000377ADB9|nr:hypothetical protein [Actinomadura flavalba]